MEPVRKKDSAMLKAIRTQVYAPGIGHKHQHGRHRGLAAALRRIDADLSLKGPAPLHPSRRDYRLWSVETEEERIRVSTDGEVSGTKCRDLSVAMWFREDWQQGRCGRYTISY
jgi:hypothetical protein